MEEKRTGRDALSQLPRLGLRVSTVIAFAALIGVKGAAKAGLLGPEKPTAAVQSPLSPASWAYGIWIFIYVLQGAGSLFQLVPHGYTPDGAKQRIVNSIGLGWQIGLYAELLLEIASLSRSTSGVLASIACLLIALAGFCWTLLRLYRLKEQHGPLSSVLLYVLFFLSTSVNTAWLSFLTAMSLSSLPQLYTPALPADAVAAALAIAVTCAGVVVVYRHRDSAYGLTLVWANVAVYGRQTAAPVRVAVLACVAACFLISLVSVLRRRHSHATELADMRQPLRGERSSDAQREAV